MAIVDLPPMSLAQPEFIDLLGRADVLIVVSSYEPDSVVSVERVLEAYPGSRVVRVCNRMPTEGCKHYLKVTPESPFFVIGEPTNFRTFSELVSELGFLVRVGLRGLVGSSWLMALGLSSWPVGTHTP